MRKALQLEFYRLFHSKGLYVSMAVGVFFCIWLLILQQNEWLAIQETIQKYGIEKAGLFYPPSVYNRFIGLDYYHQQAGTLYMLFPLLACLPFASSFCMDKKTGYLKNLLTRERKIHYLLAKFISVFFSGFFIVICILLFDLLLTMCFFPMLSPEVITAEFPVFTEDQMFWELYQTAPMVYILFYVLLDGLFFGLIAVLSLAVSVIVNLRFAAIVSGTLIFQAICYLFGICNLYGMAPNQYLVPTQMISNPYPWSILLQMIVILVVSAVLFFGREAKRDVF